jgi:hypothetical protein
VAAYSEHRRRFWSNAMVANGRVEDGAQQLRRLQEVRLGLGIM